ncbi:unnamed protein product [Calypogeia fissa]
MDRMASTIKSCLGVMALLLSCDVFRTEASLSRCSEAAKKFTKFSSESSENKVFIVYLGGVSKTTTNAHPDAHKDMLHQVLGSKEAAHESILYSYTNSFNGFAAVFSESHADWLRGMDEVLSVFPSKLYQPQTTHSWEYLGLNPAQGLWPQSKFGNDIIIGMIDTGIWPESQSFNDDGFGPIPSAWKGECVKSEEFGPEYCNKKLIGGKFFSKGYEKTVGRIIKRPQYNSPRDTIGHGTHTASVAAGRPVSNASFFGVGNGTIVGGASGARIAVYKVCWENGCSDSDILASYDEAVKDGVHLISASIGGGSNHYQIDPIAIGAFHAVRAGILVTATSGNFGPGKLTVANVSPWILTVGASTMNRKFVAKLKLGNGESIEGIGINPFELNQTSYPLVYGAYIVAPNGNISEAKLCNVSSLDGSKVKGKIIVCHLGLLGVDKNLTDLGAAGAIMIEGDQTVEIPLNMPATTVSQDQAVQIWTYINSTQFPTAFIGVSQTVMNSPDAPLVPFFNSLGPNNITGDILKPDLIAPGVNILGAFSPVANPSEFGEDPRRSNFNILSGTSQACPHVTAAAALIKSLHPDWSPSAIKSALMTTATPLNGTDTDTVLATGSGEMNPTKAADPGLIYNMTTTDYEAFLCSIGYNLTSLRLVTGDKSSTCYEGAHRPIDLNYPSIMLAYDLRTGPQTVTRTVTNVGPKFGPAEYTVSVVNPKMVDVAVFPTTLTFEDINVEKSFRVDVMPHNVSSMEYVFGSIMWSDSYGHSVRIPIGVGPSLEDFRKSEQTREQA